MTSERMQRRIDRLLHESLAISQEPGRRPLLERVLSRRESVWSEVGSWAPKRV